MVAVSSTMINFLAFAITSTLFFGITATCENNAPLGFQHLEQPQAWL
jgi:hypothetical protein